MDDVSELTCSCCGRTYPRRRLHALSDTAYICRRCGLWVALRLRPDLGMIYADCAFSECGSRAKWLDSVWLSFHLRTISRSDTLAFDEA